MRTIRYLVYCFNIALCAANIFLLIIILMYAVHDAKADISSPTSRPSHTRRVTIIAVNGPNQVTNSTLKDVFNAQRSYSNTVHVNLLLNKIVRIDEPSNYVYTLDNLYARIFNYEKYARSHHFNDGGSYTVFMVPPIVDRSALWFAGTARTICASALNRTAWATIGTLNAANLPRMAISRMAATHELFHLLGATHNEYLFPDGSANIMKSDAGSYPPANGIWGIVKLTNLEINVCQRF